MGGALIPGRVLEQVQLMIVLRVPPGPCLHNLGDDFAAIGGEVLCLDLVGNFFSGGGLGGGVREYRGAVFWDQITAGG
jgi:hypothetical protein